MTSRRRVPLEEGKFNEWYSTKFSPNLPSVAAAVEVSAAKVARVTNDAAAFNYLIERNNLVRVYKESESKAKERAFEGNVDEPAPQLPKLNLPDLPAGVTINAGIEKYASNLVRQILDNQNCTPEIEALLGIELPDEKDGDEVLRTDIREIRAELGAIILKASLKGKKAYRVFCLRGTSGIFEAIGDSSQSEFTDDRPNLVAGQPEKRQYKVVLLENNKPVGEFSAIETIVTQP